MPTSPCDATWPDDGAHHLLLGAPRSGKTTAAIAAFLDFIRGQGTERAVFLTPTRQRAAQLRTVVAREYGGTTGNVLVRTPASLAFGLLRARAAVRGEPAPTLITGPDQDAILAELISGHIQDGVNPGWPADIGPEVLSMRAFRHELRDLLMRAAEAGLDGAGLRELGEAHNRPEWIAAGSLLTEYTHVTLLGETTPDRGVRYDAATILDRAVAAISAVPELAAFDAVVYDDYQDATLATSRLLAALAERGARLLLTSNPDTGVQGFRGGLPALTHTATLAEGSQAGAFGARVRILDTVHLHPKLWADLAEMSTDLPPLIGAARRHATPALPDTDPDDGADTATTGPSSAGTHCHVLPSAPVETAFITHRARELHVLAGVPWSDMAVVVRGHHQLTRLRRALTHAGIPVLLSGAEVPLREEPAVRALLTALDAATAPGGPTLGHVSALLLSSFGAMDALGLRRLRRRLRHHDPSRTSSELLLAALNDSALRAVAGEAALERVAAMLTAGRAAAGQGVEMVLWRIWDAAGVASVWQERALAGGVGAERADADLDAVVALFTLAEQFADRRAGASPRAFIDYLADQDFPADTLAARAQRSGAIALHTAASAAGSHWPVVFVAGVQEDTWPDLRLRDTLLGAAALTDLATQRHRSGAHPHTHARQEVLHDELRTFLAAASRATRTLIVTAVLDADARPSVFFERLAGVLPPPTEVPAPLDLRGLVGTLRAQATAEPGTARAHAAASLLATLAANGVPEADAAAWSGPWTTGEAVTAGGGQVQVSPSAIETALSCPLRWFLTTYGGRTAETQAQNLGNLIHEIARDHPAGTEAELRAALDERWHELDLPPGESEKERERAYGMIYQLADYLAGHDYPVETEVSFRIDVGAARIRGQIDRVEYRPGGPHVVDLKTGKHVVRVADAKRHPQLAAYQLAVAQGAVAQGAARAAARGGAGLPAGHTGGASLLYVAANKSFTIREQPALQEEPEPWAQELMAEAAAVMSAPTFPARPSTDCNHCPFRRACPALPEGARLGEGE